MDLSIIIVQYKTPQLTLECLSSIYDYAPQCSFEVILVDNGSGDQIEGAVRESFPSVHFIESGDNTGFARANNLGIHNSHGEFVVLLNSDTKLIDFSFDRMMQYMKSHPEAGALGPRHVDGKGQFQLSCGKFPTLLSEIVRKVWHHRLSMNDYYVRDYLDQKYAGSSLVDWVSGSCLVARREALLQSGLLDERFFMYFEDVDLCKRIQNKGWKVHFFPFTNIIHYGGASAKNNLLSAWIENRKSQLYFARKYYGLPGEWVIKGLLILKYGFNGIKWGTLYLLKRFYKKKAVESYTMALAAKKIILVALSTVPSKPIEPVLTPSEFLQASSKQL